MEETKKDKSSNKSLYIVIGVLAIIILILLGWRVTKVQLFGVELVPPTTLTPTTTDSKDQASTNKAACPYVGNSDKITIANLIQAEAEAVNKEDISIIRDIFDPNATIRFQGDGTEWHDPVAHYLENFDNADVINAVHFNIQPSEQGITNNTAWFISGSSGTIIFTNGKRLDYYNELGKDTWVLKKNSSGCWVIVEFTFY